MSDDKQTTTAAAAEFAALTVTKAAETAKQVLDQAAVTAHQFLSTEATITQSLSDALRDVFGENVASGRFIDITRIPLICKSVIDTNDRIKEINDKLDRKFVTVEAFAPIKLIVYGLVGVGLTAIAVTLLSNLGLKIK